MTRAALVIYSYNVDHWRRWFIPQEILIWRNFIILSSTEAAETINILASKINIRWLQFIFSSHTTQISTNCDRLLREVLLFGRRYSNEQNNLTLIMGNSSCQTPPLLYYWSILILCLVSNSISMTLLFANVNKIPPDPSQYFNWLSFFKN